MSIKLTVHRFLRACRRKTGEVADLHADDFNNLAFTVWWSAKNRVSVAMWRSMEVMNS